MSTATASATPIDIRSQGSYPVRLGSSILNPSKAGRLTTLRYNHKPHFKALDGVRYALQTSVANNEEETLLIEDRDDEYEYHGTTSTQDGWFVLVRKDDEQEKGMTLERLSASHDFNLTKTPFEDSSAKLAARFQQLPIEDEHLLGDEDDNDSAEPVDKNNTWDYRNHLEKLAVKAKPLPADRGTSSAPQSSVMPRAASSTPVSRFKKASQGPLLTQKKRKAPTTTKAEPKRAKVATEQPDRSLSAPPKRVPNVPEVRIDRKASLRRPSMDDSGELILENETPVTEKPPKRAGAMALALAGQLGGGPISLRSAASSPASRVASPMTLRPDGMDEGEEFELGESPEQIGKKASKQADDDYFGNDDASEDDDADADADVEDLELPSPAQTHRKSASAATVTGTLDDEDDLDKQLALAMAEDDDAVPLARPAESDEESEEE